MNKVFNKIIGFRVAGFLLLTGAVIALHGEQETDNTGRPVDFVFRIYVKPDNVPAEKINQGDVLSLKLHEYFDKNREDRSFEAFANNHAEALKTVLKVYELFRANATCVTETEHVEKNKDEGLSFSVEYIPYPTGVDDEQSASERAINMKILELLCKEKSCAQVVKELDRLTSILNKSNGASIRHNTFYYKEG
ncbi:hypothetical protein HOM50_04400 [bacterium]|jgi:hypothetical protein|nr:hypothetical protein [bacterium]MBT5015620.1 hypothetical protein [bacterium]